MDNPFNWDYLNTAPGANEVFGPFAIVYLVLFSIGFIAATVVYNGKAKRWFKDPVLHRMARRWSGIAIVIFGFGLFFFLIRWLQINPFGFGRRYWLWLSFLALIALSVYAIWDYRTHYAMLKAEYDERQRQRAFAKAGGSSGASAIERNNPYHGDMPTPRPRPVKRRRRT